MPSPLGKGDRLRRTRCSRSTYSPQGISKTGMCTATSPAPFGGTLPKGEGFSAYALSSKIATTAASMGASMQNLAATVPMASTTRSPGPAPT